MNTLAEIFEDYREYLRATNLNKAYPDANIKTALLKYTLPGWGLKPATTTQEGLDLMNQVTVEQLKDAMEIQDHVFKSLETEPSGATKRTYKMHLKKFIDWCEKQRWWNNEYKNGIPKYSPKMRHGRLSLKEINISNRKRASAFALTQKQVTTKLDIELEKVFKFATAPEVRKRQDSALRISTTDGYITHIKQILGWLHNFKSVAIEELNLKLLDDIDLVYEFLDWLRTERNVKASRELVYVNSFLLVGKYHYHKMSKAKHYKDIPFIEELRELSNSIAKRIKDTPSQRDESKKWLDWNDFLLAIQQLKKECAPRSKCGSKRSDAAIALSYQKYLIAAFLGYMPPDRQRTLRELELGRTLVKENNQWFIQLSPDDYKTGDTYGTQTTLIPDLIYPELEDWINKWRNVLSQNHNFLFTKRKGEPITSEILRSMFTGAIYRLTGKAVNPHLVRAMAITHFQRNGATDAEMEALALAMKHSREMQRKVYDKRTQQEKVQPALNMMLRQKAGTLSSPPKLNHELDAINK